VFQRSLTLKPRDARLQAQLYESHRLVDLTNLGASLQSGVKPMEPDLQELVGRLKAAGGSNLKSIILYGSAVTGEFHSRYSDLNVLCLLERLDALGLQKLNPVATWWARKGHPAPLVFTPEELRHSADVFAIELLDIKANHRALFGEDAFTALEVPMDLHHLQVERELRSNLVRLRQHYLASRQNGKALLALMTESVSSFTSLFRHVLIAQGQQPPAEPHQPKRAVIDRVGALLGADMSGFHSILDLREGKIPARQVDAAATFRAYLEAVTKVVEEVDRASTQ
jgi:predicted nucleotidyltransferase